MQHIQILRGSFGARTGTRALDVASGDLGGRVNTGGEVPPGGPFTRLLSVIPPDESSQPLEWYCGVGDSVMVD